MSSGELAQELPFSGDSALKPWDTLTLATKKKIRQKAKEAAKKKALEDAKGLGKQLLDWKTWKTP